MMEAANTDDPLTRQGMVAYRSGDRVQARALFRCAAEANPDHQMAWVWLAACAEDEQARRHYLMTAIAINPTNETGQKAAAVLQKMGSSPPNLPPLPSLSLAPDAQASTPHPAGDPLWWAWARRSLGLTLTYALFLAILLSTSGWVQLAGFLLLLAGIRPVLRQLPDPARQGWDHADRIGGILGLGGGMVVVSVFAFFITETGFHAMATGLAIGAGMGAVYSIITGGLLLWQGRSASAHPGA
ncbi:MAG: hypothetical protein HC884_12810 [Chloroflexaceae bacterium]|nr:hypothetical protein [Chloroflexaceae bacterium]